MLSYHRGEIELEHYRMFCKSMHIYATSSNENRKLDIAETIRSQLYLASNDYRKRLFETYLNHLKLALGVRPNSHSYWNQFWNFSPSRILSRTTWAVQQAKDDIKYTVRRTMKRTLAAVTRLAGGLMLARAISKYTGH